jgi:serine/arginine repetitive matrix protein 1
MTKVKLDVIRPWISTKMTQMMKLEDDVVEEYVINQLEEKKNPDPKMLQ